MAVLITGYEVFLNYRGGTELIEQAHREVKLVFSGALSENLWSMNDESNLGIVEGMVHLDTIDQVVLEWEGGDPLIAGVVPDHADIESHIELKRSHRGADRLLGTLHIYSSLTPLRQSLFVQFKRILIENFVKSILVSGFSLLLFHRLCTLHVLDIAKYAHEFDVDDTFKLLELNRAPRLSSQQDELHVLVSSLNRLAERFHRAHRLSAQQNEQLKQILDERNQRLDLANQKLMERSRLATIGAVVAMVAHELRNPLGAIKASLMMAKFHRDIPSEGTDRALERIERCVIRCDHSIESLRHLSRRKQQQFQIVGFDSWIRDQIGRGEVEVTHLRILLELGSDAHVAIDPLMISQVLNNIIENAAQAIKLAGEGANGEIRVRSFKSDQWACVEFCDNGPGLKSEDVDRVFDPLYTTKTTGFGMGLSLSRNLVEEHGGSLTLEPREGRRGAVAKLCLPIAKPLGAKH